MSKTLSLALTVGVLIIGLARQAHAVKVSVGTTTLFNDSFENDPVYGEPRFANPGSWVVTTTNFYSHVQNPSIPSGPGSQFNDPGGASPLDAPTTAYHGTQVLRLKRPGGTSVFGDFGQVSAPASGSKTISFTFAMYVPASNNEYSAAFALSANQSYTLSPAYLYARNGTSHGIFVTDGLVNTQIPGINFLNNTWQIWQMDYTMVAGSSNDFFTISVDGVTSGSIPATNAATGYLGGNQDQTVLQYLNFATGDTGSFFVDAVPEPASLSLVATFLGAISIARRRGVR